MFRRTLLIIASVLALTVAGVGQRAWADPSEQDVKTALAEFERANPKIKSFMESAHGYAVFPTVGISFDAAYEHGVAIFTMAKGGLMYEASVGGQKFSFKPK